jgi:hypothetical protein
MAIDKITTPAVTDDSVTLAKMAPGTDGNLITYDASGNPAAVATGSDGQVLTSTGAGSPPAFETLPASGKILQVVTQQINGYVSVSSQTEVTTGITKAITPTASNSKILIFITGTFSMNVSRATSFCGVGLKRTVGGSETNLQGGGNNDNIANNVFGASNMQMQGTYAYSKEDSPSTTSEVTYTLKARIETSGESILFNNGGMGSFITLMEIGA